MGRYATHLPNGYHDQRWGVGSQCFPDRGLEILWAIRSNTSNAEGIGELDEIRIQQVRGNRSPAEGLLLDTADVAKRTIFEDNCDDVDVVPSHGR